MIENQKIRPAQVIGPLGEPLTLDSLPPSTTTRWVVRRKAEVVAAVNGGLLTVDEACERYGLTLEEFAGWQRSIDRSGICDPTSRPLLQSRPIATVVPNSVRHKVRGAGWSTRRAMREAKSTRGWLRSAAINGLKTRRAL